MNGDYQMCGGWGNRISFSDLSQFKDGISDKDLIRVDGHMTPRPKKGQTLVAEFVNNWVKFEFVDIDYCSDPTDMFFAKVKMIDVEAKK